MTRRRGIDYWSKKRKGNNSSFWTAEQREQIRKDRLERLREERKNNGI